MRLCRSKKCSGCGACVQLCPQFCIKLKEDEEGFLFPSIDQQNCIQCGLCADVCPAEKKRPPCVGQKAYAAINNRPEDLKKSTSGGVFSELARFVFKQGGAVYGCAYAQDMTAVHKRITKESELVQLQGSKYVQSNTLNTFIEAKRDLDLGKMVLYSGTPCQIDGLYSFLGVRPENLITADLICHGVPSPAYFKRFVNWLGKKENAEILDVEFRDKENRGWSLAGTFTAKKSGNIKPYKKKLHYFENYYYSYFLTGDIYRNCCYNCQYANMNRCGDFTMGDLWGAEGMKLNHSASKGCSLLLANTEKSFHILKDLDLTLQEIPKDNLYRFNRQLEAPAGRSVLRESLYKECRTCSAEESQRRFKKSRKKQNLIGRIKHCIPGVIKSLLLRVKYRFEN